VPLLLPDELMSPVDWHAPNDNDATPSAMIINTADSSLDTFM
jgi:hypothetical protein